MGLAGCTPDSELTDAELYLKYCVECHGADGAGAPGYDGDVEEVNLLASRPIATGDREFVHERVAYGYGPMPAYAQHLDPPDLERLVDFVMEIQETTATAGGDDGPEATEESLQPAPGAG